MAQGMRLVGAWLTSRSQTLRSILSSCQAVAVSELHLFSSALVTFQYVSKRDKNHWREKGQFRLPGSLLARDRANKQEESLRCSEGSGVPVPVVLVSWQPYCAGGLQE